MILAFNIFEDLIRKPFGFLLDFLYDFTNSYGLALIIFSLIVKLVLMPATAKAKKSSMKMSRITPRVKLIQEKYADDSARQSAEIQALYKKEGVSLGGGCLWSLLPLLILIPLYQVIQNPMKYMMGMNSTQINGVIAAMKNLDPGLFSGSSIPEIVAASHMGEWAAELRAYSDFANLGLTPEMLEGVKYTFLGIDLGATPVLIFTASWVWTWPCIGGFLMPLLSAGSQLISMLVTQKMNNSLITDENGIYDEETAKNSKANKQGGTMMWIMPLISLWIGFSIPGALSLYWVAQGIFSLAADIYLTKKYRHIYDMEDAERLALLKERQELEAEKERQRAARRAANPDGITTNTSKKKMQQAKQEQKDAAKAAAARKYAIEKGLLDENEVPENLPLSGIADRPNCKGRAYDPDRYKEK